jgi:hypothetical protein
MRIVSVTVDSNHFKLKRFSFHLFPNQPNLIRVEPNKVHFNRFRLTSSSLVIDLNQLKPIRLDANGLHSPQITSRRYELISVDLRRCFRSVRFDRSVQANPDQFILIRPSQFKPLRVIKLCSVRLATIRIPSR